MVTCSGDNVRASAFAGGLLKYRRKHIINRSLKTDTRFMGEARWGTRRISLHWLNFPTSPVSKPTKENRRDDILFSL